MNRVYHSLYIAGSVLAAVLATTGIWANMPVLYGIIPGIIGAIMAGVAAIRFGKNREDLVGFTATLIGFVYYQAYQANPVMLPSFTLSLGSIQMQDQLAGVFFGNLTTALMLVSCRIMAALLPRLIARAVPRAEVGSRAFSERTILVGFWILFSFVALPNVVFGGVIVGALRNIVYQRLTWSDAETYSGFATFGGALGLSIANIALWATSLFLLWLYLLGSTRSSVRKTMYALGPLIVIWTASVVLQGSRTYLVSMGVASGVYLLGRPFFRKRAILHGLWAAPLLFVLIQISTLFRGEGLGAVSLTALGTHILEIQGNEGTPSQIDGFEYYRTELAAKDATPNPFKGFLRGLLERPIEGLMMPVPRSLFPWKAEDLSGREFNLFFQNVRLGVVSSETFLGASPGLIGRELIKYGVLGPFTLLFWLGLILALMERLYVGGGATDFHRLFAALLIAFVFAQARDFSPVWFIPFLPAGVVCGVVVWRQSKYRPPRRRRVASSAVVPTSTPLPAGAPLSP